MLCAGLTACQPGPAVLRELPGHDADGPDLGTAEAILAAVAEAQAAPVLREESSQPEAQPPPPTATPAIEGPAPLDLRWMADLTPHQLIKVAFAELGAANVEKALYVACREGGLDKGRSMVNGKRVDPCDPRYRLVDSQPPRGPACSADNPTSTASGLFQYLRGWAGWGGYSWADIVGPDCLTDVLMTVAVVRGPSGWGPWE